MNVNDPDYGLETANIPLVVWKHSKHPEISKAFIKTLYDKDRYIKFLASVPVGMLPALKDIANESAYRDNPMVKKFAHAEKVISDAVQTGTAIGYEYGPTVQGGLLTNQHIIEAMFQDIVVNGTDPMVAAKKAEDQLNTLFETVAQ